MKRKDLEKYLRKQGCEFDRHGGKHDFWVNPTTGFRTTIPRHHEITTATGHAICNQLGVPRPMFR